MYKNNVCESVSIVNDIILYIILYVYILAFISRNSKTLDNLC